MYVLPYSTFEPITPFMYHDTNSLLTTKAWNGIYLDMTWFRTDPYHLVFVCYGVKFSSISPQNSQLTFLHPINSWFWCRFLLWSEARTILISESVVFGEPWRWCWVLTRTSLENLSHKNRLQLNGDYNYDSRLEVGKWHWTHWGKIQENEKKRVGTRYVQSYVLWGTIQPPCQENYVKERKYV